MADESIGVARVDLVLNTQDLTAQLKTAEGRIAALGSDGAAAFEKLTQSQQRATLRALQLAQQVGKTRDEINIMALRARGALPQALDVLSASQAKAAEAAKALGDANKDAAAESLAAWRAAARQPLNIVHPTTGTRMSDAEFDAMRNASIAGRNPPSSLSALDLARLDVTRARLEQMKAARLNFERVLESNLAAEGAEAELTAAANKAVGTGVITRTEATRAIEKAMAAKVADTAATQANTAAIAENAATTRIFNSRMQAEVATGISEVAAGNIGRLRRTVSAFLNQAGLFSKMFTPAGMGITAVAAGLAGLAIATEKGESEFSNFNKAIAMTGDYAGTTANALSDMSRVIATQTSQSTHAAADALQQVVASGEFTGSQIQQITESALNLQRATGQSVDETIKQFASLQGDPVAAVLKLNDSMHFLTASEYEHIKALQDSGQEREAAQEATKAYADATDNAAKSVQSSLGSIQKAWQSIKEVIGGAISATMEFGRVQTPAQQLAAAKAKLQNDRSLGGSGPVLSGQFFDPSLVGNSSAASKLIKQDEAAVREAELAVMSEAVNEALAQHVVQQNAAVSLLGSLDEANRSTQYGVQQAAIAMNTKISQLTAADNLTDFEKHRGISEAEAEFARQSKTFNRASGVSSRVSHGRAQKPDDTEDKMQARMDRLAEENLKRQEQAKQRLANFDEKAVSRAKDMLTTEEARAQLQVEEVGMTSQQAQRAQKLLEIDAERMRALTTLRAQQAKAGLQDTPEAQAALREVTDYYNKAAQVAVDSFKRVDDARQDVLTGVRKGLEQVAENTKDQVSVASQGVVQLFGDMTDAVTNFADSGKFSLQSFAQDFEHMMIKIEMNMLESKAAGFIASLFGGGDYTDSLSQGGFGYGSINPGMNANGGVYDSPDLSRYSNGVYSTPHLFRFANGGVFGEAGPEAIVPLTRSPNGKLGVSAQASNVSVVVQNNSGGEAKVSQSSGPNGSKIINVIVGQAVNAVNSQIMRGGGTFKAIQQTFGLNRRGIPVGG